MSRAGVGVGGAGRVGEQLDRRLRVGGRDPLARLPDADDDRGTAIDFGHEITLPIERLGLRC